MEPRIVSSAVSRFLVALRRHPAASWAGVLLYAAIVTFPHDDVQALVGRLAKWMGRAHLYQAAGAIAFVIGAGLSLFIFRQASERAVRGFWVIILLLSFGTWRLLTANNTELVHYPQYIPEGAAIMALTLSPVETLCWIALLGSIDEDFQYWGLHGAWSVPFDFNDVYMDLLGGAMGLLLAMAILGTVPAARQKGFWRRLAGRPGVLAVFGVVVSGLVLWACGKMVLFKEDGGAGYWFALSRAQRSANFWFFNETWAPHTFHTLLPLEGPALMAATAALFAVLERRVKVAVK